MTVRGLKRLKEPLRQVQKEIGGLLGLLQRGGPGSGHHGHAGRPGEVGGSLPSGEIRDPSIPVDIRAMRFFHATDSESGATKRLESGDIQVGPSAGGEGFLAPVAGRTYATSDLEYALIYALGGNVAGNDVDEWMQKIIDRDGRYGYIFEIDTDSLNNIQPDEDAIGRAIHNETYPWLNRLAEGYLSNKMLNKVMMGEYIYWAKSGKMLVKYMSDSQKHEMIRDGVSIANDGNLKFKDVWRIDKYDLPKYPKINYSEEETPEKKQRRVDKIWELAEAVEIIERHHGPGPHPGTGTPQDVHGNEAGVELKFRPIDYSFDQTGLITAWIEGEQVGSLSFGAPTKSKYFGKYDVELGWVVVPEEHRRKGIATAMMDEFYRQFEGKRIVPYDTTKEGKAFMDAYVNRHYGPGPHSGTGTPQDVHGGQRGTGFLSWQDRYIEHIPKHMGKRDIPEGMMYQPARWLGLHSEGFGDVFRELAKAHDYAGGRIDWSYIEEKIHRFEKDISYERDREWIFEGEISPADEARRQEMLTLWREFPGAMPPALEVARQLNLRLLERDLTGVILAISDVRAFQKSGALLIRHYGPGPHPGTGTSQDVHGGKGARGEAMPSAQAHKFKGVLFHGTHRKHLQSISEVGLVPEIGPMVEWAYGEYMGEEYNHPITGEPMVPELLYFTGPNSPEMGTQDESSIAKAFSFVRHSISYEKYEGDYSRVTWEDIRKHGLLVAIGKDDLPGDLYFRGEGDDFYEVGLDWETEEVKHSTEPRHIDEYYTGPEPGDYFTPYSVTPTQVIYGDELVRLGKALESRWPEAMLAGQMVLPLEFRNFIFRHYGPGPHSGTGTSQDVHGGDGAQVFAIASQKRVAPALRKLLTDEEIDLWHKGMVRGMRSFDPERVRDESFDESWIGEDGFVYKLGGRTHDSSAREGLLNTRIHYKEESEGKVVQSLYSNAEVVSNMLGWLRLSGSRFESALSFHADVPPTDEQVSSAMHMIAKGGVDKLEEFHWEAHNHQISETGWWGIEDADTGIGAISFYNWLDRNAPSVARSLILLIQRHYGPGPHPGTGTSQDVHGGGRGYRKIPFDRTYATGPIGLRRLAKKEQQETGEFRWAYWDLSDPDDPHTKMFENKEAAMEFVAKKIRKLDYEIHYAFSDATMIFDHTQNSPHRVTFNSQDILALIELSKRPENTNIMNLHNHPPQKSGIDIPPSFSDFDFAMGQQKTDEWWVVTPNGKYVVTREERGVPFFSGSDVYQLENDWNRWTEQNVEKYFPGYGPRDSIQLKASRDPEAGKKFVEMRLELIQKEVEDGGYFNVEWISNE